jgi:hypothetical protein
VGPLNERRIIMNKITFGQFLEANDLPPIGEIVTTPRGDKVEITGYSFTDKLKVHAKFEDIEIDWFSDQVRLCTWEGRV